MATAPATTAPTKVHVEVAGFQAFGEFHGYNNDCAPDAELMARHPFDGSQLTAAALNQYWQTDYIATGHVSKNSKGQVGGATLANIYWHLTSSVRKLDPTKARVSRYVPVDSMSQTDLRKAIIQETVQGHTIICYLGNAQALAYNERGVYGHFIALGGIDSDAGYLVGNGDDVAALGGHGIIACRWYGWNSLAAAQINGIIALAKVAPVTAKPIPTTGTVPTGWKDTQGADPSNFAGVLSGPNGVAIVRGMRQYVLTHGWSADNLPLAVEYDVTQLELANPASGRGVRQDFRYGSLGCPHLSDGSWGNSYPIMVGNELAALTAAVQHQQATLTQIAQLAKE